MLCAGSSAATATATATATASATATATATATAAEIAEDDGATTAEQTAAAQRKRGKRTHRHARNQLEHRERQDGPDETGVAGPVVHSRRRRTRSGHVIAPLRKSGRVIARLRRSSEM